MAPVGRMRQGADRLLPLPPHTHLPTTHTLPPSLFRHIIFGEAKLEDLGAQAQSAAAAQFSREPMVSKRVRSAFLLCALFFCVRGCVVRFVCFCFSPLVLCILLLLRACVFFFRADYSVYFCDSPLTSNLDLAAAAPSVSCLVRH